MASITDEQVMYKVCDLSGNFKICKNGDARICSQPYEAHFYRIILAIMMDIIPLILGESGIMASLTAFMLLFFLSLG